MTFVSRSRFRNGIVIFLGFWTSFLSLPGIGAATETVRLKPREGAAQNMVLLQPADVPIGAVVLYAGGSGSIGVKQDGKIKRTGNFLVRSRQLFAEAGFLVAVPDRPSDWAGSNKFDYRLTQSHALDALAIIDFLRSETKGPVWLVSTSRGSISAANNAARLGAKGPDGIVLSASVTNPGNKIRPSVNDAALERIEVPVLVLGHEDDDCYVTPWSEQRALVGRLIAAPSRAALSVTGGKAGDMTQPCGPFSHHGFLGIERETIRKITDWMKRHAK